MNDLISPKVVSRLVGVVDLKNRQAVHAVSGKRESYQPVVFCDGDPIELIGHYLGLGIQTLYVADLDSIGGGQVQADIIEQLCRLSHPHQVLVDIGWTGSETRGTMDQLATISETNSHSRWIAATESMTSTEALGQLAKRISPKRLLLGLDFMDGELIGPIGLTTWVDSALQLGFAGAVVLDLASVGKPTGPTTQSLCQSVKCLAPNWTLFSGGGIQTTDDIGSLIDAGCDRCLVATALHCIL